MNKLTVKQALEQGYETYLYPADGFQRASVLGEDEPDFTKEPMLTEKEPQHPNFDGDSIKDIVANQCDEWWYDETRDDDSGIYDLIMELDFSDITSQINEKLKEVLHYKQSNVKLIEG